MYCCLSFLSFISLSCPITWTAPHLWWNHDNLFLFQPVLHCHLGCCKVQVCPPLLPPSYIVFPFLFFAYPAFLLHLKLPEYVPRDIWWLMTGPSKDPGVTSQTLSWILFSSFTVSVYVSQAYKNTCEMMIVTWSLMMHHLGMVTDFRASDLRYCLVLPKQQLLFCQFEDDMNNEITGAFHSTLVLNALLNLSWRWLTQLSMLKAY